MKSDDGTQMQTHADALTKFMTEAHDDPAQLKKIQNDPLSILANLNIPVEEEFQDIVTSQLRTMADIRLQQMPQITQLLAVEKSAGTPQEIIDDLYFHVTGWGLVLKVGNTALEFLKDGGSITATALGLAAAAAAFAGPAGIAAGFVMAVIAAAIAIQGPFMNMVNRGKGVNMTWTWPQLACIGGLLGLPIITAV